MFKDGIIGAFHVYFNEYYDYVIEYHGIIIRYMLGTVDYEELSEYCETLTSLMNETERTGIMQDRYCVDYVKNKYPMLPDTYCYDLIKCNAIKLCHKLDNISNL